MNNDLSFLTTISGHTNAVRLKGKDLGGRSSWLFRSKIRWVVTARPGNQERNGDNRWGGDSDCAGNDEIEREHPGRRRRDAPFDVDCIIVSRMSADGRARCRLR